MVSSSGNEVTIQSIIRIEEEYMVVNGRLAGTTDDPRVMMIPLDNIDYLGFREPMKTQEIEAIFGRGLGLDGQGAPASRSAAPTLAAAAAQAEPEAAAEAEEGEEPVKKQKPAALSALLRPAAAPEPAPAPPPPPPAPEPAAPAAAEGGPLLPGKAALLERLRKSRQGQK
jgi:hypothetical protein